MLASPIAAPASAAEPPSRRVVDDLGRTIEIPARPSRIVSLAPSLTETLYAIGLGDRLVGTAEHSTYPLEAAKLPVVGSLSGDPERIVAAKPDVVVATTEGNDRAVVDRLERFGIPVYVSNARNLDETIAAIERLAAALGPKEAGRTIAARMRERVEAVAKLPALSPQLRVLWLVWPDPAVVCGGNNFLDDLIRRAGAVNAFGDSRQSWPTVGVEALAARPVDVVFFPRSRENDEPFRRAFDGPLKRIFPPAVRWIGVDGDRAERPGPRLVDALEELARALRDRSSRR